MRLYRVETIKGHGPYRNPDLYLDCETVPCKDGVHPTPRDELSYLPPYADLVSRWGVHNIRYGFAFNDQLNRWFAGDWFARLAEYDYGVAEYTIHPRQVYVTPTQAVFNGGAKSLKRIRWTPIPSPSTKQDPLWKT